MYGHSQTSFSPSSKSSNSQPKGYVAFLLGLIIVYQFVNQIFLHQAVSHEDDEFETDAACTAVPGAAGYSNLCMEAQLFKGWHEDSHLPAESAAELEDLLAVSPPEAPAASQQPTPATASATSSPVAAAAEKSPETQGLRGEATNETKLDEVKPEAIEGMLWDLAWAMGGGDKSHEAPEKHGHKKPKAKSSAFMAKKKAPAPKKKKKRSAKGLTDLQEKLESKMQRQARRHAEHRALRALSMTARSHSEETDLAAHPHRTAWAANLDHLTHELEDQMRAWQKERAEHATAFAEATKKKYDVMTPWAHNLDDMTHDIEHHLDARKKERAEHEAAHKLAHEARLKAAQALLHDEAPATNTPFMGEIEALGRELCHDPERRHRPACAQFLHSPHGSAAAEERMHKKDEHANAMAHIKLLEKHLKELEEDREHENEEIKQESTDFLKELCADPARHSYPTCAHLLAKAQAKPATAAGAESAGGLRSKKAAASTAAPTMATKGLQDAALQPHELHWTPMKESEALHSVHAQHMGASPLLMHRQELRGAHWDGKIPKVACVTVLPQGQVTETLMKYFMDNYNLQHYDGARELVIVYHNDDKEASRIAHLYADGTNVKAAAARGGDGYPSATAYRYGAWLAHDADIVVRWDFEGWHHPNRITMQVRAMALSKRPSSLVARVTAFDADGKRGTVAGGAGPHGSLMGDAAWMRKHWMPALEEESALLHGLHSSDVVQVAMPELLSYHDVSMLGPAVHSWVDVDV